MDFLSELRAFYDWLETNPCEPSQIALWCAINAIADKAGKQTGLNVPISTLELKTGLSRSAVYRARNSLKQKGLIDFYTRSGRLCSTYALNSLCASKTRGSAQKPKRNTERSTKYDAAAYEDMTGTDDEADEIACARARLKSAWHNAFGETINPTQEDIVAALSGRYPLELVELAISTAAANSRKNPMRYMGTLLLDWRARGIETADDYYYSLANGR